MVNGLTYSEVNADVNITKLQIMCMIDKKIDVINDM